MDEKEERTIQSVLWSYT